MASAVRAVTLVASALACVNGQHHAPPFAGQHGQHASKPWGPPGQSNGEFAPGWNGKARTPPLGWRSWNAFGNRITQDLIKTQIDLITAKKWTIDGKPNMSLADAGYAAVGIDEGWEGCGMGVNRTQHYVNGTPAIEPQFPDIKALVDYGHAKDLLMGFYENGCKCGEHEGLEINYEGDVKMLHDFGFDAVKLDRCGQQLNMTLYAKLMKESGKNYSIENCHWGVCDGTDDSSCPSVDWCPFNWYRSSGDINAGFSSWFSNLQSTIKFQSWDAPVSQPGCWAYPDMLEVGRVRGTLEWNRAHFGAWCIVSAPLVLGMDLSDDAMLTSIMDIITNKEAIAVNQQWAGHPGTLLKEFHPPLPKSNKKYIVGVPCSDNDATQPGWAFDAAKGSLTHKGMCADFTDAQEVVLQTCDASKPSQKFLHNTKTGELQVAGGRCLDVFYYAGPRVDVYPCNHNFNENFTFSSTGVASTQETPQHASRCLGTSPNNPEGNSPTAVQVWAKPQPNGAVAVLFINSLSQTVNANVTLKELNITASSAKVRDVWRHQNLPAAGPLLNVEIGPTDSQFFVITP